VVGEKHTTTAYACWPDSRFTVHDSRFTRPIKFRQKFKLLSPHSFLLPPVVGEKHQTTAQVCNPDSRLTIHDSRFSLTFTLKLKILEVILSTSDLKKHYGPIKAVNGLNLRVEKGAVYGILGPNGSGKTTTLGMLLGIIHPSSGNFSWFDNGNKDENRHRIGALLEQPNFYPYLSGEQNLRVVARIKGVDEREIEGVLSSVNLLDRKKSAAKTYSLGMRQRLALASALLGNPDVLVLDEPTNGLDPQGIAEVRDFITKQSAGGRTIIIASHILDEVEKVCTHVSVIKKGNLLAEGSVAQLIKGEDQLEISAENMELLISSLNNYRGINKLNRENNIVVLNVASDFSPAALNKYLHDNNIAVSHLNARKKRLEEQFLELTAE
jgi:ABC-2 type transport system ATP-binding protein